MIRAASTSGSVPSSPYPTSMRILRSFGTTSTSTPLSLPFCPSFQLPKTRFAYSSMLSPPDRGHGQHDHLVGGLVLVGLGRGGEPLARGGRQDLRLVDDAPRQIGNIDGRGRRGGERQRGEQSTARSDRRREAHAPRSSSGRSGRAFAVAAGRDETLAHEQRLERGEPGLHCACPFARTQRHRHRCHDARPIRSQRCGRRSRGRRARRRRARTGSRRSAPPCVPASRTARARGRVLRRIGAPRPPRGCAARRGARSPGRRSRRSHS